jgi:hypothetical protein
MNEMFAFICAEYISLWRRVFSRVIPCANTWLTPSPANPNRRLRRSCSFAFMTIPFEVRGAMIPRFVLVQLNSPVIERF